ncbi:hypothetical protein EGYY_28540 [Eggerthella sp. YY7918]|nr:hypothetical protein EGYY_28540 [Eggerthella sp. YY7918]
MFAFYLLFQLPASEQNVVLVGVRILVALDAGAYVCSDKTKGAGHNASPRSLGLVAGKSASVSCAKP